MLDKLGLNHKRNGVALLVVIALILTIVIMVSLTPANKTQKIINSVIVCTLWIIPSIMFYMLIVGYKKSINKDVIPKIVTSLKNAMIVINDEPKIAKEDMEVVSATIAGDVVKEITKHNPQVSGDTIEIMKGIANVDEISTNNASLDVHPTAETPIPPKLSIDELQQKAKTIGHKAMAGVKNISFMEDLSNTVKESADRRAKLGISIDEQIKIMKQKKNEEPRTPLPEEHTQEITMQSMNDAFAKAHGLPEDIAREDDTLDELFAE